MTNIVLFGGSFDPIHNGHLAIGLRALEQTKSAKVIFIPNFHSPFKGGEIEADHRINMIKKALEGEQIFALSTYEADLKADKSYTIDTVMHFKQIYPADQFNLFFLIGSDQIPYLDKWKDISTLLKLVKFIVYLRKGYPITEEEKEKYSLLILNGEEEDISSTDIRLGRSFYAPKGVLDYIVSNHLYFIKEVEKREKPRRYLHSLSVADLAYKISLANHLDPYKAFGSGLLHDITRMKSEPRDIKRTDEEYSKYFPDHKIPSYAYHQFTAPLLLKREFGFQDEQILTAIRFHTTGKKDMDWLDKILYASDKIEPTRGYDSTNMINLMLKDYKTGFINVLEENRKFLLGLNKGQLILDDFSTQCFECYLKG